MFNPRRCYLSTWCGEKAKPVNYRRVGSPYECLKKGYGMGKWSNNTITPRSLENIPYLTMERKNVLNRLGMTTLFEFTNYVNNLPDYTGTKRFLERDLSYTNPEQYNKLVLFLYDKGIPIAKLPKCK